MPVPLNAPAKPCCAHCGKDYGSRNTTEEQVVFEDGSPVPSPKTNMPPVKGAITPALSNKNPIFVHMDQDAYVADGFSPGHPPFDGHPKRRYVGRLGRTITWTFWDGTYYTPYAPFCTLKCAEQFAYAAYRAGYRIVKAEAA